MGRMMGLGDPLMLILIVPAVSLSAELVTSYQRLVLALRI
jgi:hypothetical protein